jgi:aminoglycoside phosphotransferase family enzyme
MLELPPLVQALLEPKTYPHTPRKVELMQTQMSFLFLTGDYVYKVKKPVDLGYLDYTTLEKRRFFCQQELKLNRRLCPDIYLEVVPIFQHQDKILLGGKGEVVEYAVKMRQLPPQRMMDVLLSKNQVSKGMVRQVAQKLVDFHRQAETNAEISSYGSLDTILTNTEENFTQTQKYIGVSISGEQYQSIKAYTDSFAEQNIRLFKKRVKEGRIRDCHGDLHSAHICFIDGICIYDCIEFNDRFRYCDVASEIAFLAMDLDYHRHPDLSQHFIDAYVKSSQDEELLKLLHFYKCYRAYVRGKVESFKLDDPHIPEGEKSRALAAARRYFQLAKSYVDYRIE